MAIVRTFAVLALGRPGERVPFEQCDSLRHLFVQGATSPAPISALEEAPERRRDVFVRPETPAVPPGRVTRLACSPGGPVS